MKQGYYYTVAVFFFTGVLLAVFFSQTDVLDPLDAQQQRAVAMDDFLNDLHRDIDRAAFIAGFRSLLALEESVATSGEYLADIGSSFSEAFLNGSINGTAIEVLENSTFNDYVSRVHTEARKYGLRLNISLQEVSLYHITPWDVAVDYSLSIRLNDSRAQTRWLYEKNFSTRIDIFGMRDPMYSVETNNKLPNTIEVFDNFVEYVDDAGDANDTTVLLEFLNESYYSASELAPSFLMRFTGNFSASEFGIASLINLDALDAQGEPVSLSRTVVDFLYFEGVTAADRCTVLGNPDMPSYFKLDDVHANIYEVTGELESSMCP